MVEKVKRLTCFTLFRSLAFLLATFAGKGAAIGYPNVGCIKAIFLLAPPPPEELRQSRRNLAAMANAAVSNAIYSSPQFTKKLSSSASTLQSEISANCSGMNIAHLGKRIDRKLDLGKKLDFVYILFSSKCRKKFQILII